LEVLSLRNCVGITDLGLTGIKKEDAERLLSMRTLYLEQEPEVFRVQREWVSLSSLKGMGIRQSLTVAFAVIG
jgi:hypothetical protein